MIAKILKPIFMMSKCHFGIAIAYTALRKLLLDVFGQSAKIEAKWTGIMKIATELYRKREDEGTSPFARKAKILWTSEATLPRLERTRSWKIQKKFTKYERELRKKLNRLKNTQTRCMCWTMPHISSKNRMTKLKNVVTCK
jgi:hypothetical protein